MSRTYRLYSNGDSEPATLEDLGNDRFRVTLDGEVHEVAVRDVRPGVVLLTRDDGAVLELAHSRNGSHVEMQVGRSVFSYDVLDEMQAVLREREAAAAGGDGAVTVSMPGRVIQVLVDEGAEVSAGDGVVIVEAMKMENELKAPVDGTVSAVKVAVGDVVESGALLVSIDPAEG